MYTLNYTNAYSYSVSYLQLIVEAANWFLKQARRLFKEELVRAVDKQLRVISTIMLFKKQ